MVQQKKPQAEPETESKAEAETNLKAQTEVTSGAKGEAASDHPEKGDGGAHALSPPEDENNPPQTDTKAYTGQNEDVASVRVALVQSAETVKEAEDSSASPIIPIIATVAAVLVLGACGGCYWYSTNKAKKDQEPANGVSSQPKCVSPESVVVINETIETPAPVAEAASEAPLPESTTEVEAPLPDSNTEINKTSEPPVLVAEEASQAPPSEPTNTASGAASSITAAAAKPSESIPIATAVAIGQATTNDSDPTSWSVAQVKQFLLDLNMDKAAKKCEEEEVDGVTLMSLDIATIQAEFEISKLAAIKVTEKLKMRRVSPEV